MTVFEIKIRMEEQLAFSDWVNSNLGLDPDLKHLLPIDAEGRNLYDRVKDGILLWYDSIKRFFLFKNKFDLL